MRKNVTKLVVATLIAVGAAVPANAQDYKISLGWDAQQTVEQNYTRIETDIAKYCSITSKQQGLRSIELTRENENCRSQLMDAFIEKRSDRALTQYHAQREGAEKIGTETASLSTHKEG